MGRLLSPTAARGASADASDEELLRRMRTGDAAPLDELYTRYRRQAFVLANRMLGSPENAEEVVQDAFLSIWARAVSYDDTFGLVRPWLFSVVHHRAIDRLRRVRERHPAVSLDQAWMVPSSVDVLGDVCRSEQRECIRAALALLPASQQDAINRAYFDGYTSAEIGKMVEASVGTVKSRMRLGLARMRRLLEAEIAS